MTGLHVKLHILICILMLRRKLPLSTESWGYRDTSSKNCNKEELALKIQLYMK